jgi:hypothetical protein
MPVFEDLGQEPSEQEIAEDRLQAILPSIEAAVGYRFGGLWIDERYGSSTLAVAVVGPTQEDVDRLGDLARSVDWGAVVRAVRYSERELEEFAARLEPLLTRVEPGLWFSLSWSAQSNRVEVELTRADPELLRTLASAIPSDALFVTIAPGLRFEGLKRASAPNGLDG